MTDSTDVELTTDMLPAVRAVTADTAAIDLALDHDETGEATAEWLHALHDDSPAEPPPPDPPAGYTQTAWDRRQVQQLQRTEAVMDYLTANPHLPDGEATRRTLLILQGGPAALDAYLTALEPEAVGRRLAQPMLEVLPSDEGSIYAALAAGPVIEPSAVIPPGAMVVTDGGTL